ncbi:MAG: bifunctional DNA-formamidopyrimidine glycosylase/DNA-(apurinic or apyrimidinic site) lyase [Burkholderiales bacterium]|nr:bifunctional DNA-formamidopyrimidine glycosylase/DNA-(apurinic or apyrimidinic site) lyase [Burkholderiales bacterium]
MPELPEVEITRRGIAPHLAGSILAGVAVRNRGLRWPVPHGLARVLVGERVRGVARRGKYLVIQCERGALIVHLGMSGSLRVLPADAPPGPHDHFDLRFNGKVLRLRDPRRFGAVLWWRGAPEAHPLLARLGVEPLSAAFDGDALYRAARGRRTAIKHLLMDARVIAGIGNIYAAESLYRAGIHPATPAGRLSRARCARLAAAVRETLLDAIAAGGSTLRDFVHADGAAGRFQVCYFVYDRAGAPCRACGRPVRRIVQGQRSTYFCPHCQR